MMMAVPELAHSKKHNLRKASAMPKIVLSGYIMVPTDDLKDVCDALPLHCRLTKDEPGCLSFTVEQDSDEIRKFHVHEIFANRQAFDAHQKRVAESSWGQISRNVERFYTVEEVPPE